MSDCRLILELILFTNDAINIWWMEFTNYVTTRAIY